MAEKTAELDPFAGMEEVKSQWIKWGKVGDWVRGTLTDVREAPSQFPDKKGEIVKSYEIMVSGGSIHYFAKVGGETKTDEKPTVLEPGSIYTISGKPAIDQQMRNVKIGQIFGMRYSEDKPNKNPSFSPSKVIKVLVGEMDPNYQGQTAADVF